MSVLNLDLAISPISGSRSYISANKFVCMDALLVLMLVNDCLILGCLRIHILVMIKSDYVHICT